MDTVQTISSKSYEHYDRIRRHTPKKFNRRIDRKTQEFIQDIEAMGPEAIRARLGELDKEWDIDRFLMLMFSSVVLPQLVLARKNKKWLRMPLVQTSFLFLHSTFGWCPPMLVLRPLGFRSRQEIDAERDILVSKLAQSLH